MTLDPTTQDVLVEVDEETSVVVGDEVRLGVEVVEVPVAAPAVVETPAAFTPAVVEVPAAITPAVIELPVLPVPELEVPLEPVPVVEVPVAQGIPGVTGPPGPQGPEGPAGADAAVLETIPDLTLLFENRLV